MTTSAKSILRGACYVNRRQVDVLTAVNSEWEDKLKAALVKSTEEAALRMKLEHEVRWAG